jgi:integrase
MLDVAIPDLTFPMVKYGRDETPWDLRVLLYKEGAKANPKIVFNQIAEGQLGRPLIERLELVKRIHLEITAQLVGGGAKPTAQTRVITLRTFVAWADEFDQAMSLESVEDTYRHWCDHLQNRVRLKAIKNITAYHTALYVSSILDAVLNRSQPLITTTRLKRLKRSKRAVSVAADKQRLTDTFAFGQLCLDVIDSLPYEAIFGPLPVRIQARDGRAIELWSKRQDPSSLVSLQPEYKNKHHRDAVLKHHAAWDSDRTLRTRYPLVNLRILAELMLFIGQTGMNLSQAHNLLLTQCSYKSTIDGFEVRDYKERRKGEVLFEIFSEYKDVFEEYLAWRKQAFGTSSDRLFPFIRQNGALETTRIHFDRLRDDVCSRMGIAFVPPRMLRNTRVNWLLRESRDPEQTAEQAQHKRETLLSIYEQPSLQVAMREIIRFQLRTDPRLGGTIMACPAPGSCDGAPEGLPELPPEAPKPDCMNPSGCLFCTHHRDVDSEDYVFSTASMRHLNTVILPRFRPLAKGKADSAGHLQMVIDVLTAKLKWFSDSNAKRKAWVDEALEKLAEGDYHVHWRYLIESAMGV